MKVLKIDDGKCYFLSANSNYLPIVDISKNDIFYILNLIYENEDAELDKSEDIEILNDVEKIIYTNLEEQVNKFISEKSNLTIEIENEFKDVNDVLNQ